MAFAKTFKALSDPDYIKNDLKFLLFVLCSGLIGGYCIALYLPDMYSQEMLQQMCGPIWHHIWCYTCCDRVGYIKESRFMERISI